MQSTYFVKYGGNIKDAQAHFRHSQGFTTLGIYTKEIPESVKAAVEQQPCVIPQSRQVPPRTTVRNEGNGELILTGLCRSVS